MNSYLLEALFFLPTGIIGRLLFDQNPWLTTLPIITLFAFGYSRYESKTNEIVADKLLEDLDVLGGIKEQ